MQRVSFHFQSSGYMTDDSAQRYETQVKVLFNGTANATRRQALPQLHEVFAGRDVKVTLERAAKDDARSASSYGGA